MVSLLPELAALRGTSQLRCSSRKRQWTASCWIEIQTLGEVDMLIAGPSPDDGSPEVYCVCAPECSLRWRNNWSLLLRADVRLSAWHRWCPKSSVTMRYWQTHTIFIVYIGA